MLHESVLKGGEDKVKKGGGGVNGHEVCSGR